MIDRVIELVVAAIILVIGIGIGLALLGADTGAVSSLIAGFTKLAVYALIAAILVAIPISMIR